MKISHAALFYESRFIDKFHENLLVSIKFESGNLNIRGYINFDTQITQINLFKNKIRNQIQSPLYSRILENEVYRHPVFIEIIGCLVKNINV